MYYNGKEIAKEPMQSLGMKLRLERERQQIDIRTIADETCISKRYLEAIESDDHSSLPGEFFYRSFVRQYSKYLGWDPDETEKQINLVSSFPNSEGVEASASASISNTSSLLGIGADQQTVAIRESLNDKPIRWSMDDGLSKSWLIFAAVVVVGCIAYFMWPNEMQRPVGAVPVAAVNPGTVPAGAPVLETPKQEVAKPDSGIPAAPDTPQPVTTPLVSAPPPVVAERAGAGQFALTVRAKQSTWIRLTADGARIHGGTLEAGQEKTLNAKDAELVVGNAGTIDVIYNGKVLSYGGMGEVKTLLMKPDGWKFKPKPLPEPGTTNATPATTGSGVN